MTMDSALFYERISGRTIVSVTTQERTNAGAPPDDDEAIVSSITLDDGTKIEFSNEGYGYTVVTLPTNAK